jgi:hypothetical protein
MTPMETTMLNFKYGICLENNSTRIWPEDQPTPEGVRFEGVYAAETIEDAMIGLLIASAHCPSDLEGVTIIVDDGQTFHGTALQFADCFFSNVSRESIEDWAKSQGSTVEFVEE